MKLELQKYQSYVGALTGAAFEVTISKEFLSPTKFSPVNLWISASSIAFSDTKIYHNECNKDRDSSSEMNTNSSHLRSAGSIYQIPNTASATSCL